MSPVMYHMSGGNAFFLSCCLLILSALVSFLYELALLNVLATILSLFSMALIAFSATPLPDWLVSLWFMGIVVWLLFQNLKATAGSRFTLGLRVLVILVSIAAALMELPHHRLNALKGEQFQRAFLVGDSISAGVSGELTWPAMMAEGHDLDLVNLSRSGATTTTALEQVKKIPDGKALILLEIGGNALLSGVPSDEFAESLERLLHEVVTPGRRVVMFELPLPPLFAEHGEIQRALAAKFRIDLISKRVMGRILTGESNTIDGLHLSEKGHRLMEEAVWRVVGGLLKPG